MPISMCLAKPARITAVDYYLCGCTHHKSKPPEMVVNSKIQMAVIEWIEAKIFHMR